MRISILGIKVQHIIEQKAFKNAFKVKIQRNIDGNQNKIDKDIKIN